MRDGVVPSSSNFRETPVIPPTVWLSTCALFPFPLVATDCSSERIVAEELALITRRRIVGSFLTMTVPSVDVMLSTTYGCISVPPLMMAQNAFTICIAVVVMFSPKAMRERSLSRMYLRCNTSPVSSLGMPTLVSVPKPKE